MKRWVVCVVAVLGCGGDDERVGDTADSGMFEVFFPDGVVTADATETVDTLDTTQPIDTFEVAPDTAAEVAPETVVDTAPEAEPETIAETSEPETIAEVTPETVDTTPETSEPETIAETMPETIADTTPETSEPETIAETAPETTEPDTKPDEVIASCQDGGCETDMTGNGDTCATAYIIGRPNAQTGFGHAGSTVGAANDSDFTQAVCGDSFGDRFYRIYLKVGEQLWVNANPSPQAYDVTFGLYRGLEVAGIAGPDCGTPITCVDNDDNQTTPDQMPYQAVIEGWHTIVVDGRNMNGDYTIVVTLDCAEDNCCCE